jgi:hypothetical protein
MIALSERRTERFQLVRGLNAIRVLQIFGCGASTGEHYRQERYAHIELLCAPRSDNNFRGAINLMK